MEGERQDDFSFSELKCASQLPVAYSDDLVDDLVGPPVDPERGGWKETSGIVGTAGTKDARKAERRGKAEASDGEQTKQGAGSREAGSRAAFGLRVQTRDRLSMIIDRLIPKAYRNQKSHNLNDRESGSGSA
jgi:hypothetical protein